MVDLVTERNRRSKMDRSFRNNADFKMNQQNFKLSDFGIDARPDSRNAGRGKAGGGHRYAHAENAHVQLVPMSAGGRAVGGRDNGNGSILLQSAARSRSRASPRGTLAIACNGDRRCGSPNQLAQMQSATVTDGYRASSPGDLSGGAGSIARLASVPTPSRWKPYGGQESGVNKGFLIGVTRSPRVARSRLSVNGEGGGREEEKSPRR